MNKLEVFEKLKIDYENMIIPNELDDLINENTINCISNFILIKIEQDKNQEYKK